MLSQTNTEVSGLSSWETKDYLTGQGSEVASLAEWDWAGMRDEFCTALGNPQPGRPPLAPDYLPSVSSQWSTPVRDGLSSVRVSQHALVVALTSPGRLLVDRSSPVSGPPVSSEHVPLVHQDGGYPGPLRARAAAFHCLRRLPHTAHVLRVSTGVRFCTHHRPSGRRQVGEASRKVSWTFLIHLLSPWRA